MPPQMLVNTNRAGAASPTTSAAFIPNLLQHRVLQVVSLVISQLAESALPDAGSCPI